MQEEVPNEENDYEIASRSATAGFAVAGHRGFRAI
jgi:hypothetical protein